MQCYSVMIWAVLVLMAAYYYVGKRAPVRADPNKPPALYDFRQWRFDLFSCTDDVEICLCAICCPGIRWALTISIAGLGNFWAALVTYVCLAALAMLTCFSLSLAHGCSLILLILMVWHRQALREPFGMERGGFSMVTDVFLFVCCSCCTIAQDARHVEEAIRCGHGPGGQNQQRHGSATR